MNRIERKQLDKQIGKTLRKIRLEKGYTQQQLASEIGLSFQQLQKYESGDNRISASLLYDLSKILKVKVVRFYKAWDAR